MSFKSALKLYVVQAKETDQIISEYLDRLSSQSQSCSKWIHGEVVFSFRRWSRNLEMDTWKSGCFLFYCIQNFRAKMPKVAHSARFAHSVRNKSFPSWTRERDVRITRPVQYPYQRGKASGRRYRRIFTILTNWVWDAYFRILILDQLYLSVSSSRRIGLTSLLVIRTEHRTY